MRAGVGSTRSRSWLTLLLLLLSCAFEPKVRPLKAERLSREHVQVLATLDPRGEYVLLAYEGGSGEPKVALSKWRVDERCDVPVLGEPVAAALPGTRKKGAAVLYVPIAIPKSEDTFELALVDDKCALHGPYGEVSPNSVRSFVSRVDDHAFLVFRDRADTLSILDPSRSLTPRAVATHVTAVRTGVSGASNARDVLWLIEDERLTQRELDGELVTTLGSSVSSMTLDPAALRISFVDDGDLYEATSPDFTPELIASDACSPRYTRGNLDFFWPCRDERLWRVRISNGRYESFEDGVFASSEQEGIQLDYVHAEDATQLVAHFPDGERIVVSPSLVSGSVYVLDEQRIAGIDAEHQFGVWDRQSGRFSPVFRDVDQVIAHRSGKKHKFWWLVYHQRSDGLGNLSLLDEDGMAIDPIAHAVPSPEQQGFLVEHGSALPNYPFSSPLVVLLEDARPVAGQEGRFRGRLKALAMTGDAAAVLAEDVSSYALVRAPAPGLLYAVEDGPSRGLWYTPL